MSIFTAPLVIVPRNHYRLNEKIAGPIVDTGTAKNNGTNNGPIPNQPGLRSRSYLFNAGNSEFIQVSNFNFTNQGTVMYWANATTTASIFAPIGSGTGPSEPLSSRHTTTVTILWRQSSGTALNVSGGTLSANTWVFVGIVGDGSFVKLYVNGFLVNQVVYDGTAITSLTDFFIGKLNSGGTNFFSGLIQDVRFIPKAISSEEIKHVMNFGFTQNIISNPNKKLILWNKMGRTVQTVKSELGNNLIEGAGSVVYQPIANFNSGLEMLAASVAADAIKIPAGSFRVDFCTVEFWYQHTIAFTQIFPGFIHSQSTASFRPYLVMLDRNLGGTNGLIIDIQTNVGTRLFYQFNSTSNGDTFYDLGGPPHLYSIVVNSTLPLTQRIKTFKDGIIIPPAPSGDVDIAIAPNTLLGTDLFLGITIFSPVRPMHGIMGDIKIYNYPKTITEILEQKDLEYPIAINGTNKSITPLEQLIFWNRLGNTQETTNSEIGPNLVEGSSVTYTIGKFGNGFLVGNTGTIGVETIGLPAGTIGLNKFTIEFQYKHTVSFTGITNQLRGLFGTSVVTGGRVGIGLRTRSDINNFNTVMLVSNGIAQFVVIEHFFLDLTAQDTFFDLGGSFHHYTLTFDSNAIGTSGAKLKFYKDGVLVPPFLEPNNDIMPAGLINGSSIVFGHGGTTAPNSTMCGIMDNLKISNYSKTAAQILEEKDIQEPIDLQKVVTI